MSSPDEDSPDGSLPPLEFVSPGKFGIHNPDSPSPAHSNPRALWLTHRDAIRQHSLELIRQARRTLRIYSPDLEPWLYSSAEMASACKAFLLASPHNRLHILLHDSQPLLHASHLLLPLIERLSSRAEIRLTCPQHEVHADFWLSADDRHLLLRKTSTPDQGQIFHHDPHRCLVANQQFTAMWAVSRTDINLRRMTL